MTIFFINFIHTSNYLKSCLSHSHFRPHRPVSCSESYCLSDSPRKLRTQPRTVNQIQTNRNSYGRLIGTLLRRGGSGSHTALWYWSWFRRRSRKSTGLSLVCRGCPEAKAIAAMRFLRLIDSPRTAAHRRCLEPACFIPLVQGKTGYRSPIALQATREGVSLEYIIPLKICYI